MQATVDLELATPIEPQVAPNVWEKIEKLGRTEDLRLSPENRRIALAGFVANACLVLDIRVSPEGRPGTLAIDGVAELRSKSFKDVHGVDFIGEDILVVANRGAAVTLLRLPPPGRGVRTFELEPFKVIDRAGPFRELGSPGSLAVTKASGWYCELLVCNTFHNRVTRHAFNTLAPSWLDFHATVLQEGLDVPDGVTVSPDGRTVAVSNHHQQEVLLYDRRRLGRKASPIARLTGVELPHGLRFSPDGRDLYAADAGHPVLQKYRRPADGWHGVQGPLATARVLSEEMYLIGRVNPEEGGPKGVDITRDGRLVVVASVLRPLAIFEEATLFGGVDG